MYKEYHELIELFMVACAVGWIKQCTVCLLHTTCITSNKLESLPSTLYFQLISNVLFDQCS